MKMMMAMMLLMVIMFDGDGSDDVSCGAIALPDFPSETIMDDVDKAGVGPNKCLEHLLHILMCLPRSLEKPR